MPNRSYSFKEGLAMMAAKDVGIDPYLAADAGEDARSILVALRSAKTAKGPEKAEHIAAAQSDLGKLNPKQHGKLINALQAKVLALQGRGGDTAVAHLEPGEIIVPRRVLTHELMQLIAAEAAKRGIDPKQLIVGSRKASINPATGTEEFGWFSDAVGKVKVWFDGEEPENVIEPITVTATRRSNELEDAPLTGLELGSSLYMADQLTRAGNERGRLDAEVSKLHPADKESRTRLKAESRQRTPAFFRGIVEEGRPELGPRPGSDGTANRTNPIVNAFGKAARVAGPATFAMTLKEANDRIDNAENKTREKFGVAGALLGGYGTGILTGLAGRGISRSANGLAGSMTGAVAGENLGYGLYDGSDRLLRHLYPSSHGS